ncbi:MAG: hypothetical protein GVY34_09485, partial [Alphaproteobacteria bacterium]|nr:hypothetical protein [Alphaproteobacteria bacterium]
KTSDDDLALFFEAGQSVDLPDPLRARIMADAAQVAAPAAPNWRARLKTWTRGWAMPTFAGGVGATLAGLYLGLVMPVSVYDAPVWMDGALGVFDQVTAPIVGVRDPLEMGF